VAARAEILREVLGGNLTPAEGAEISTLIEVFAKKLKRGGIQQALGEARREGVWMTPLQRAMPSGLLVMPMAAPITTCAGTRSTPPHFGAPVSRFMLASRS
jgi:hypothetical protein